MIILVILSILCAFAGSALNYFGIVCMYTAFELSGGRAIGMFLLGVISVLCSLVAFAEFSMLGKMFIDELKAKMKGE